MRRCTIAGSDWSRSVCAWVSSCETKSLRKHTSLIQTYSRAKRRPPNDFPPPMFGSFRVRRIFSLNFFQRYNAYNDEIRIRFRKSAQTKEKNLPWYKDINKRQRTAHTPTLKAPFTLSTSTICPRKLAPKYRSKARAYCTCTGSRGVMSVCKASKETRRIAVPLGLGRIW